MRTLPKCLASKFSNEIGRYEEGFSGGGSLLCGIPRFLHVVSLMGGSAAQRPPEVSLADVYPIGAYIFSGTCSGTH